MEKTDKRLLTHNFYKVEGIMNDELIHCEYWKTKGGSDNHGDYKEPVRDWECKEWFDNKQLKSTANYKNGDRVGEFKIWHKNGQMKIYSNRDTNEFKEWSEDGTLTIHTSGEGKDWINHLENRS